MTPDFFFAVVFVILIPLAIICSGCVVADTILAILNFHDAHFRPCEPAEQEIEIEQEADDTGEVTEND